MAAMADEIRRGARRFEVWFPIEIESETTDRDVAISKDVSPKGILLATPTRVEVGAEVKIRFTLSSPKPVEHVVEGVIVRVERKHKQAEDIWRYQVAVQFDQEIPELEEALALMVIDQNI